MLKVISVLRTIRNITRSFALLAATLLLSGIAITPANAQVIDRIEINQVGDEAEIQIQFITRIQYLRQVPLKNGDIRVYFNLLDVDPLDPRLIPETKKSPRSDITPPFTITYPELDSSLTLRFGKNKMWNYHISPGKDGRSISIFTPAIKPKNKFPSKPSAAAMGAVPPVISPPAPVPTAPDLPENGPSEKTALPSATSEVAQQPESAGASPVAQRTPEETEQEAQQLIGRARFALQDNRIETAIRTLNRLLELPPNQQSQPAQKLIGEAREKNGEFAKARVEYELYLKLYPNATDVKEVKERLAGLPAQVTAKPAQAESRAAKKFVADEKMTVFGSVSQYYYKGVSHTDSNIGPPTPAATDQSMLISSLDLTGRKRSETTDTRIVLRDSYKADYLPGKVSSNRLNAAFVEQSARDKSYMYRLGRQTGSAGGAPGRFDGAVVGYSLNPTWRVNGVIGTPVEFVSGSVERKTFTGMSVDLTRLPEQWSGSGYLIEQRVGDVADRKAIGMETHYFDAKRNYTGLLEYDALFKKVNIGMFQGNWMAESGANYFTLVDHRKSPSLQLTNALSGQTIPTIAGLLQSGVSMDTLRTDTQALSAISNMFMVGMNRPYSSNLRLGGDFRVVNTSGTGASSMLPASPGTGNVYSYSLQAIGNNLFFENDLGVMSGSYTDARTYKGRSLAYSQVQTFRQYWRLDLSLQLYSQNDNLGNHQTRTTPSFKLNYRLNDSVNFEGEAGIDDTHNTNATQDDKIRRKFFFVGYRWDFR